MKANYHSHTTRCHHAKGSDEEYILSAINGGFNEIGFSDHCPWPFENGYSSTIRMDISEFEDYVNSVRALKEKYKNQISVKIGLECEYYEEYMPWLKNLIDEYQLDYVIFGNHFSENEVRGYYFGTQTTTKEALYKYMETAIKGMETGLFSYFAHPDLFMRSWTDLNEDFNYVCRQICEKAKELDILLEYNISGYIYNRDFNVNGFPNINFWTIAAQVGCKAIIGIDAHNNMYYETEEYRNRALKELADLKIEVVDTIPFINHH